MWPIGTTIGTLIDNQRRKIGDLLGQKLDAETLLSVTSHGLRAESWSRLAFPGSAATVLSPAPTRSRVALVGAALLTACSGDAPSATAPPAVTRVPTSVTVSPSSAQLASLDQTVKLTAAVRDQNGNAMSGAAVAWSSSVTAVATVDGTGLVTAVANGSATITATAGTVSGNAAVTVEQIAVATSMAPDSLIFAALGDTATLAAAIVDANGHELADAEVGWASADTSVATVNAGGLVTAVAGGNTTITATAGEVSGSAPVTVQPVAASISLDPPELSFAALGDTATLAAVVVDANGHAVTDAVVAWSSADPSVASVDSAGLVTAVAVGSTEVTAASDSVAASAEVDVASPSSDRDVLAHLFRTTGGESWRNRTNWLTDKPLGQWHGVETDGDGRVTAVRLPENLLAGAIPAELGDLSHLETLNLRENKLRGTLPPEIGTATRLREIDLGHTELDGAIPATLGRLVDLRRLNFEYVPFTGSIPPELGALRKLEFLNLYRNRLRGYLPAELAGLRSLRTLYVDENRLTGAIPSAFTQLKEVQTFYWRRNEGLCAPGTTDFEMWRSGRRDLKGPRCNDADVAVLERLYHGTGGANWTRSTGWLERAAVERWHGIEADSLGRVTLLDLSSNGLRGRLPRSLAELDRLSVLRVDGNPLAGPIPQAFDALALDEFRYGDTELCVPRSLSFRTWLAAIPVREGTDELCAPLSDREILEALYDATRGEEWAQRDGWLTGAPLGDWHGVTTDGAGRVDELALYGNNLRGRVPAELGQLDRLRLLDLSYNWLGGPIPPDLANVETFEEIYLESNLLDGSIPLELGSLPALTHLYLLDNRLEGTIPPELGTLSNLQDLRISENRLTGRIPPEFGDLSSVATIWMDGNELEGEVPPELGSLSSVATLYLGSNKLSGEIPPELGALENIQNLALDFNDLSGPIPAELGDLASLTGELNLVGNRLSGEIPAELGNLRHLAKLRLGRNDLSGALPPELGRMHSLEWLDLSSNPGLAGPLPSTFTHLANLGRFEAAGTKLCVAAESQLADPAIARRFRVPLCEAPAERSSAYLIQAVQSALYPVPLVAGEDALLRVFPISPRRTDAPIPPARASSSSARQKCTRSKFPASPRPFRPSSLTRRLPSTDPPTSAFPAPSCVPAWNWWSR